MYFLGERSGCHCNHVSTNGGHENLNTVPEGEDPLAGGGKYAGESDQGLIVTQILGSTAAEQQELSNRFARTSGDKWTGVAYEVWDTGCPILPGSAASFECECRYTHNGGDHVIFVGEVQRMSHDPDATPLLYYRGRYTGVAPAT